MNAIGNMRTYLNTHEQEEMTRTKIYQLFQAVDDEQQADIAAAVQAEREACAKVAESNKSHTARGEFGECCDTAEEIAAAIRARNGTKEKAK